MKERIVESAVIIFAATEGNYLWLILGGRTRTAVTTNRCKLIFQEN